MKYINTPPDDFAREANAIKESLRPKIEVAGSLEDRLAEYERSYFRKYQLEWITDASRFRCCLKARQTGFSDTAGYEMFKSGMLRNVDQNLISTSLMQTENTIRYCRKHMAAVGVKEKGRGGKREIVLPNGNMIRALPANQATSQGWPGDMIFDEMAWYRRSKEVWDAAAPSVTAVKGRISCISTPYEAGPHNMFWTIAVNDGKQYPLFSRHQTDIVSASRQGLDIDMDELRSLFDADTWARLYMLKFFTDDDSFFSLEEINAIRGDCIGKWSKDITDRRAGWDIAKKVDASEVVGIEVDDDHAFVRGVETWRKINYVEQKNRLLLTLAKWKIKQLHIDETGVGNVVHDFVRPAIPANITQYWHTFTGEFKAEIAQTMKRLAEEMRITIPEDDRELISQFLSIKRQANAKGISYDIARNASGHGDRFWALALACTGLAFSDFSGSMISALKRKAFGLLKGFR